MRTLACRTALAVVVAALAVPACAQDVLRVGDRILADLTRRDATLDDGSYADCYQLTTVPGERYMVVVASHDFDAYLAIGEGVCGDAQMNPDLANNDLTPPDTTAGAYFVARGTQYVIIATSFRPGQTGQYMVAVEQ